jgi:predicted Zn-ribbon and HTH transcriptional regulator
MYSCGLKLGPAAILNQPPFFEMASKQIFRAAIKEVLRDERKYVKRKLRRKGQTLVNNPNAPTIKNCGLKVNSIIESISFHSEFFKKAYMSATG